MATQPYSALSTACYSNRFPTLTPIGSFPPETQPRGFAVDPSGRYLLAVGQLSNSMTSYAINKASGRLAKLKEYKMGKNPNWVETVTLP